MLKTDLFEFDRHGIIKLLVRVNCHEIKRILNMCVNHARLKKIKKPYDWDFSALTI